MMKGWIFNGARRTSRYWFYWLPPTVGFYYLYKYLKEKYRPSYSSLEIEADYRNHFYNSKEGHAYLAGLEAEAEAKVKAAKG
jgi:UcrQ family